MTALEDVVAQLLPTVEGGEWAKRVFRLVTERGQTGATDDELQVALQAPGGLNNLRARRSDLSDKGLLEKTTEKRATSSGSTAAVHVLAPSLRASLWPSFDASDCTLADASRAQPGVPMPGLDALLGRIALLAQQAVRAAADRGAQIRGELLETEVAARLFSPILPADLASVYTQLDSAGLTLDFRVEPVQPAMTEDERSALTRLRAVLSTATGGVTGELAQLVAPGGAPLVIAADGSESTMPDLGAWGAALAQDDELAGVIRFAIDVPTLVTLQYGVSGEFNKRVVPALLAVAALGDYAADPVSRIEAHMHWDTHIARDLWALARRHKQLLLAGPPGTGKTRAALALAELLAQPGAKRLVQFHPSYGYEDFVEGIRPVLTASNAPGSGAGSNLAYVMRPGVLREIVAAAVAKPSETFVLVIDEINRANLPRVLGELLYTFEYRGSVVQLPYSGDPFFVPDNVWFIGTMNTADRSVALMDSAMRRRFKEFRLGPDLDALRRWHVANTSPTMGDEAVKRLKSLNADVVSLLDEDRAIGHSFLMVDLSLVTVDQVWREDLEPVLRDHLLGRTDELEKLKERLLAPDALSDGDLFFVETDAPREELVDDRDLGQLLRIKSGLQVVPRGVGRVEIGPISGYAGTVLLPSGRRVVVRPKAGSALVPDLLALAYATLAPPAAIGTTPVADAPASDWLLVQLAAEVQNLLNLGLRRGYVVQRENLPYVRGRLRPGVDAARLPFLDCEFSDFVLDTPENRLLRSALEYLRPGATNLFVRRRLQEVIAPFRSVALVSPSLRAFDDLSLDRLNEHYRPSLRLARLALEGAGVTDAPTGTPAPAYLLKMWRVWELAVAQMIRSTHQQVRVREQPIYVDKIHQVSGTPSISVSMSPDIVLGPRKRPNHAIDVKWRPATLLRRNKRILRNDNLYQLFTYCRALGCDGTVIYPLMDDFPINSTYSLDGTRLHVRTVDLDGPDLADLSAAVATVAARQRPSQSP